MPTYNSEVNWSLTIRLFSIETWNTGNILENDINILEELCFIICTLIYNAMPNASINYFNPLTAGAAYIQVLIFISKLGTTF